MREVRLPAGGTAATSRCTSTRRRRRRRRRAAAGRGRRWRCGRPQADGRHGLRPHAAARRPVRRAVRPHRITTASGPFASRPRPPRRVAPRRPRTAPAPRRSRARRAPPRAAARPPPAPSAAAPTTPALSARLRTIDAPDPGTYATAFFFFTE